MTTIKTTCATCGTVELFVHQMLLEISGDEVIGSYSFVCPTCFDVQERDAGPRIVMLLQAAGVPTRPVGDPERITEAEITAFSRALHAEPAPTRML